jgi:hypothetical protein
MPGEGDINRALGHCRSIFSNDASEGGFAFHLDKGSGRSKRILVGLHPFHGKLSSAQRDAVLNPREDRIIVFTTNCTPCAPRCP